MSSVYLQHQILRRDRLCHRLCSTHHGVQNLKFESISHPPGAHVCFPGEASRFTDAAIVALNQACGFQG